MGDRFEFEALQRENARLSVGLARLEAEMRKEHRALERRVEELEQSAGPDRRRAQREEYRPIQCRCIAREQIAPSVRIDPDRSPSHRAGDAAEPLRERFEHYRHIVGIGRHFGRRRRHQAVVGFARELRRGLAVVFAYQGIGADNSERSAVHRLVRPSRYGADGEGAGKVG